VNDEVLILRADDSAERRGIRSNRLVGSRQQATVRHMLAIGTQGLKTPREGWRELRIHQEAQSCAPQDGMIILPRCEFQNGRNVLGFEIGIIHEDFVRGRAGGQQVEYVLHPDAKPASTRGSECACRPPTEPLDNHRLTTGAIDTPHRVKQKNQESPEWNELKPPFGESINLRRG
jgi:hypothetical protein